MKLLDILKVYQTSYKVTKTTHFSDWEGSEDIVRGLVIPSTFGRSVELTWKHGGKSYMPVARDSSLSEGDELDFSKTIILTLDKPGEPTIYRMDIRK